MPKRKQDPTVGGIAHTKLAKTLIRARAERTLEDDAALERQATALVDQLRDAHIGARQRAAGRKGKGVRREEYRGKPIPRPAGWIGYRLIPRAIEFWTRGAFRLHNRLLFIRSGGRWKTSLLQP